MLNKLISFLYLLDIFMEKINKYYKKHTRLPSASPHRKLCKSILAFSYKKFSALSTYFSFDFFPPSNMHITYTAVHLGFFSSKLYLPSHSISGTLNYFFPFNGCRVNHIMVDCN